MTTTRDNSNQKIMTAIGVSTVWTELIQIKPNSSPATFFVWDDGSNTSSSHLRFDFSHDGTRWCTSINGTSASIVKGATTSVCVTPMDFTNDVYISAPYYRMMAKKVSAQESMNASAWWPDNR